ncbi:MAG: non-hydrolyzing UDP-N-acetylglucosamine 2-epimerase [Armatimonadota bacterium]
MKNILVDGIVGTRPNMMKMAALARAINEDGTFRLRLIHTGQHYDSLMSDVFFQQLGLPIPDFNLGVGSGSQGSQTAHIIEEYEKLLLKEGFPKGVVVVGDVTSTIACALTAVKLGIPVAHVEAGLRSNDRTMPEEINRIVTDSISDLLLVSDPDGLINLGREGHSSDKVKFVGNVMIDTLFSQIDKVNQSNIYDQLGIISGQYAYLTLHRPSNVDDPVILRRIISVIADLSNDLPFIFAIHPRTKARIDEFGISFPISNNFRVTGPLSYFDNMKMIKDAKVVLSDSGGIQEEASALNVPCMTLRYNTERPSTVDLGSSELVGNDPTLIRNAWLRLMSGNWKQACKLPLWDGLASRRIIEVLKNQWS